MSSNYSSLLFATCISAFLFSLNFTASYILTSQERFNIYALLNVTSLFAIAIFTNLFIPKISGTIYLMILIVLPAYINFMLLNVGIGLIYYNYHIRNIMIANLLLISLFIFHIYFLNG
jgi:O-antigen/teichoic acid export membrane protein